MPKEGGKNMMNPTGPFREYAKALRKNWTHDSPKLFRTP